MKRKKDSHKGDFGHLFLLAGSSGLTGAAVMVARSCLRAGAGLVTLGVPETLIEVFEKQLIEVMTLALPETKNQTLSDKAYKKINNFLEKCDCLAIGPGLSANSSTQVLVRKIIKTCKLPMVIDADAINALAGHLNILRNTQHAIRNTRILTPHPGEMARLTGKTVSYIQENRKSVATKFAKEFGVTLILKGHNTLVADSKNCYVNRTGNPGMASAGMGDCLTGIVGAFLAQGLDSFSAAKFGAYIHGLAGDLAAKEKGELGLIASDLIEKIPEAIKRSSRKKLNC
ncbi:MAG: NAD(P)H-hydrate dehydratase [Candidatus Omnitrophota bacterium]